LYYSLTRSIDPGLSTQNKVDHDPRSNLAYQRCVPLTDPCSLACQTSFPDPVPRSERSSSLTTMIRTRGFGLENEAQRHGLVKFDTRRLLPYFLIRTRQTPCNLPNFSSSDILYIHSPPHKNNPSISKQARDERQQRTNATEPTKFLFVSTQRE
jgi:hypothetical protein